MNEKEEHGLLILEQQKHLQGFQGPGLRYFGATNIAGQCGRLLGKMRRQEVISDWELIQVFGADVGAYDDKRLETLLGELEKKGAVTVYRDGTSVRKIEESMNTESEILNLSQEIWEDNRPHQVEEVSKDAILYCGNLPRLDEELNNHLVSEGYLTDNIEVGMNLTQEFKMLRSVDGIAGINQTVYHTPVLGNVNLRGVVHQLKGLQDDLKIHLENTLKLVAGAQGTPLNRLHLPVPILHSLHQLGLINVERVETTGGITKDFAFTPSMWGKFGLSTSDEQEHVRALLSCVQFGRICPTEVDGKPYPIKYPGAYLGALRNRRKVGPSSMIGTDYLILVREGIVKVEPNSRKPDQWDMILIKDDVADRAYRIVKTGIAADVDIEPRPESLTQFGMFENSVQTRLQTDVRPKATGSSSDYADKELVKYLRGEKS